MKKFLTMFMMSLASFAWISCDTPGKDNEPQEPESPYYEFPLEIQEEGFEAADNGVSINVSSVKEENIVFNLVPGSAVKSYRMTVYPKAMLYNVLLNEGNVEGTQEQCEATIISLLSASTLFNQGSGDFAVKEFDWANSAYATAPIIPDCEYYIIALSYYDEEGLNPASLSIGHITTPAKELNGDPQIGIDVEVGYSAFIVRYHPNEDCKYFAHWVWTTEEISEFIDLFGEKLMGDFCRSAYSDVLDATLEENLAVKMTFEANSLDRKNTAIAIALDANKTPSTVIMRQDFELKDIPEGEFEPKAKIEAGSRIGATLAYFDVEMEKNCMSCFYRIYTAEQAAQLKAAGKEAQAAEALSLANEGWGVLNPRFSFDTELEILTGDACKITEEEHQAELVPDTEYVVVYVAKNYFQELSDLCFSKPFRTKKLVKDTPDACAGDVNLYFTDISRWGFTFNFDFDYSKIASYRFQLVYPYDEGAELIPPHYINDRNNREKWMTFFYDTYVSSPAGFDTPIVNVWTAEKAGYDGYAMFGYESGITYVYAYCAEDINGVVGPVKFVEVKTTEANPGPNPTMTLEGLKYDDETRSVSGKFIANEDAKMIKYIGVTINDASLYSACALNDLVNTQRRTYDAYMTLWESQLIELGLSTNAESVTFGYDCEKNSDTPVLIAAISIGEDKGEDVYSPMVCKIYYKGEFKDLSDFRTPNN